MELVFLHHRLQDLGSHLRCRPQAFRLCLLSVYQASGSHSHRTMTLLRVSEPRNDKKSKSIAALTLTVKPQHNESRLP